MTTFFQEQREVLSATQALRRQLLNVLGDVDLGFRPADGCLSLAEVCREMGEIQHTYMESFRTFRHGHGAGHRVWLGRPHGYQLGTAPNSSFCTGVPCSRNLVTRGPLNGSRDFIQAFW
jgi:hypothetical protein